MALVCSEDRQENDVGVAGDPCGAELSGLVRSLYCRCLVRSRIMTPWGRGEAWSSRRPVKPEVAGSNPVVPATSSTLVVRCLVR